MKNIVSLGSQLKLEESMRMQVACPVSLTRPYSQCEESESPRRRAKQVRSCGQCAVPMRSHRYTTYSCLSLGHVRIPSYTPGSIKATASPITIYERHENHAE